MGISNKYRFGELIPMSRADIAAGTIGLEQYDALSDIEKDKCLKRDFIWKAPNVNKLIAEGADMDLVFWQNSIRKSLRTKPANLFRDEDYKRDYVNIVSRIRDMVMESVTPGYVTWDGQMVKFSIWVKDEYAMSGSVSRQAYCAVTSSLFYDWTPEKIKKSRENDRFGYTKEEIARLDAEKRIHGFVYSGTCPAAMKDMEADKIYDVQDRGRRYFAIGCSSFKSFYYFSEKETDTIINEPGRAVILDLAKRSCLDICSATELTDKVAQVKACFITAAIMTDSNTSTSKKRKTKFKPASLEDVRQIGGSNVAGDAATPDNFLNTFHFKGGEFGNWLNKEERNLNFLMCFNAFNNLADILGINKNQVSLGDKMSIAFGSRGHSSGSAHFEWGINVINLTRMKGAGCLAHEWGHALDHYIASRYEIPNSFATEMNMYFRYKGTYTKVSDIAPAAFTEVMEAIKNAKNFQEGSKKFDEMFVKQGHGYWSSKCEMWARAFDCYILDKLNAAGIKDTYLCRGAESFAYDGYKAYPVGEEREKINKAFDKLIETLFK